MNLRSAWRLGVALTVTMAALAAAPGHAAGVNYAVQAGVGQSDNIRRTADNEVSETIGTVGLEFSVVEKTRRLDSNINADVAYFEYFDNTYDGEIAGNVDGTVDLRIVPERFDWVFQDNFGQVQTDPFAPVTPDNRENINYFSTGPNFLLHFNSQTGMRLSGRFANVTYEKSSFDNDRYSGAVAMFRNLSAASAVSANVQTQKTEFASGATATDYEKREAFGRYEIKGERTHLGLDLGYTELKQTNADQDGWLARFEASRRATASSTVSARLGHEFSDAGSAFQQQQGYGPVGLETHSGTQTPNPFTSEYATVGWDFSRRRTGFGVGLSYFDESYEKQPQLDDTRIIGDAHFTRELTANLRLQLGASYSKNEFKNATGDYDETGARALLGWQLGRSLWLSFEYQRFDRSSDLAAGGVTENRGWIELRYATASSIQPGADSQFARNLGAD